MLSSQASVDAVSEETAAASSSCSLSPRSKQSSDKEDEVLIDFTTPETPHSSPAACDVAVADDGEILFVGPDFAGIRPADDGMFGNFAMQSRTSPPASDVAVADDGEILLVGPNFPGTWSFLDGGTFGEFPSDIGARSKTNPFLADIFASSSGGCGGQAAVTNGSVVNDEPLSAAGRDTGISRPPVLIVGGGLPSLSDQSETQSPCSLDVRSCLSSDSILLHPLTVSVSPSRSPVVCETNIDHPASLSSSPVTFVVSSWQFATRVRRMD